MTRDFAVLALVTDAYGGQGGIAQYNRDLFGALADTGAVSSIVVMPRYAAGNVSTPVRVRQVLPRRGRVLYAAAALRQALSNQVDAVFCGHLFMAPLASLIARLKRAKLIVQLHGIEAWPRPGAPTRNAIETADLVLCVSRYTRAQVLSWAAIAPERAIVLPNTVGADFTPGDGAALRTMWGLEDKRVLLSVGRMSACERYKGHDRVISAIPHLVQAGQDVVYVTAGEGDDRARLQALAQHEGVADRVRFVGALDAATLVEAYRMADLFVMPSTGEGFGIAFLEAMACGTPALGLDAAGARDALADGELGTLTSEAQLTEVLARLLAQGKPDARALSAAVARRFGRAPFVARVCAVFAGLRNAE